MSSQAVKTFKALATKLLAAPKWTLGNFRQQMKSEMDQNSWRLMLPGMKNTPEVVEYNDQISAEIKFKFRYSAT